MQAKGWCWSFDCSAPTRRYSTRNEVLDTRICSFFFQFRLFLTLQPKQFVPASPLLLPGKEAGPTPLQFEPGPCQRASLLARLPHDLIRWRYAETPSPLPLLTLSYFVGLSRDCPSPLPLLTSCRVLFSSYHVVCPRSLNTVRNVRASSLLSRAWVSVDMRADGECLG
jgi:hypothetical protein